MKDIKEAIEEAKTLLNFESTKEALQTLISLAERVESVKGLEKNKEGFKSCPFCGSSMFVFIREARYPCYVTIGKQVYCNCGASGSVKANDKEATEAWNDCRIYIAKMLEKPRLGKIDKWILYGFLQSLFGDLHISILYTEKGFEDENPLVDLVDAICNRFGRPRIDEGRIIKTIVQCRESKIINNRRLVIYNEADLEKIAKALVKEIGGGK